MSRYSSRRVIQSVRSWKSWMRTLGYLESSATKSRLNSRLRSSCARWRKSAHTRIE